MEYKGKDFKCPGCGDILEIDYHNGMNEQRRKEC
jgi:hypothetical protein